MSSIQKLHHVQGVLISEAKCKEHFPVKRRCFCRSSQKGWAHPLHRERTVSVSAPQEGLHSTVEGAEAASCIGFSLVSPSLQVMVRRQQGFSCEEERCTDWHPQLFWILGGPDVQGSASQLPRAGAVTVEGRCTDHPPSSGTVTSARASVTLLLKPWLLLRLYVIDNFGWQKAVSFLTQLSPTSMGIWAKLNPEGSSSEWCEMMQLHASRF